jgi:acyl carrier protein
MEKNKIRDLVVEVVVEIQRQSGRPSAEMNDNIRPIGDLDGFDSLNAEEATAMLCERLGVEINENIFVAVEDPRALRVREVVDRLHKISAQIGVKK